MLNLVDMVEQQLILMLLIALGFFLSKIGYIEHNVRHFVCFLSINVLIPCSLFSTLVATRPSGEQTREFVFIIIFAFVVEALCFFVAKALFKNFPSKQKTILAYCLTSPNAAFIGLPIIDSFYGSEGVLLLAAFMIPLSCFMYFFSYRLFLPQGEARPPLWRQLLHPTLVAIFIGLIFMSFQIQPPRLVLETTQLLASCTTPIALLPIGAILADIDLRSTFFRAGFWFSALRLIVIPLFAMVLAWGLGASPMVVGVITLLFGMPAAISSTALATAHKGDVVYSSKIIVLSTVLSMLTLPLLALLVDTLF